MSVSCSDCFSDLLCCEESETVFSSDDVQEYCSSDLEYSESLHHHHHLLPPDNIDFEESITVGLIDHETEYIPGLDYIQRFQSQSLDSSARAESISWILKVHTSTPPFLLPPLFPHSTVHNSTLYTLLTINYLKFSSLILTIFL